MCWLLFRRIGRHSTLSSLPWSFTIATRRPGLHHRPGDIHNRELSTVLVDKLTRLKQTNDKQFRGELFMMLHIANKSFHPISNHH